MLNYEELPNRDCLEGGFRRWIEHGTPMGSFGMALLKNDLRGAVLTAGGVNLALIPAIVRWMYDELPANCWGSEKICREWQKSKQPTELPDGEGLK